MLNLFLRSLMCVSLLSIFTACSVPTSASHSQAEHPTASTMDAQPSFYTEGQSEVPELYNEARRLLEQGDIAQAEERYRQAITIEPHNPLGYIGVGTCRLTLNDLSGAEQIYRKALELDSQSTQARIGLGAIEYGRQHYAQALDWYQQALSLKPDLADAHYGIALCSDALGDTERAVQEYEAYLGLVPDSKFAAYAQKRKAELQEQHP
jgi:tetratricopeptide (TPR) repeat protein